MEGVLQLISITVSFQSIIFLLTLPEQKKTNHIQISLGHSPIGTVQLKLLGHVPSARQYKTVAWNAARSNFQWSEYWKHFHPTLICFLSELPYVLWIYPAIGRLLAVKKTQAAPHWRWPTRLKLVWVSWCPHSECTWPCSSGCVVAIGAGPIVCTTSAAIGEGSRQICICLAHFCNGSNKLRNNGM